MNFLELLSKVVDACTPSAIKYAKRRWAERRALAGSGERSAPFHEQSTEETLGLISGEGTGVLGTVTAKLGGKLILPAEFAGGHIKDFVKDPRTISLLKSVVQARLAGTKPDPDELAQVRAFYSEISGDNDQRAEGTIGALVNAIVDGTQSGIDDESMAALVQAGFGEILKELGRRSATPPAVLVVVDANAREELEEIVGRRTLPGERTSERLATLIAALNPGGKFELASQATKVDAFNWGVRIFASVDDLEKATSARHSINALGGAVDPLASAILEAAQGGLDRALRAADAIDSADARSVVLSILVKRDQARAQAYLAGCDLTDPTLFTGTGWGNALLSLLRWGDFATARRVTECLPTSLLETQPTLTTAVAMAAVVEMVPETRRASLFEEMPYGLLSGTIGTSEALDYRTQAIALYERARSSYERLQSPSGVLLCDIWLATLKLLDPATHDETAAFVKTRMEDPKTAVEYMMLAHKAALAFETEPLERLLARKSIAGSLSEEERVAKALLLDMKEQWPEFLAYLNSDQAALRSVFRPGALVDFKVRAYIGVGEFETAQAIIDEARPEIGTDIAERMTMSLRHRRGDDPSTHAIDIFRRTQQDGDLHNVLLALDQGKRWGDALPFSSEFFKRQPSIPAALRHINYLSLSGRPASESLAFIDQARSKLPPSIEIRDTEAWMLFKLGRYVEAKAILVELMGQRDSDRDLTLDMNLALQSGDWEHFAAVSERAWEKRTALSSQVLLTMADLASLSESQRAIDLAQAAVAKAPTDTHILLGAHTIAVQLGNENVAWPWFNAARANNEPDGPITSFTLRQLAEMVIADRSSFEQRDKALRSAEVPLHLAAMSFKAPLFRFLVGIPRANADQIDPRGRTPIPIRSSKRGDIDCSAIKKLCLDITTVVILEQLGRLEMVIDQFDEVLVASQFFMLLLEERRKVVFHQPSRIEEARLILRLLTQGRLMECGTSPDPDLSDRLGFELASLLAAAQAGRGRVVHEGKIFEMDSYMETLADLRELAPTVVSTFALASALLARGAITQEQFDDAVESMERQEPSELEGVSIELDVAYLDRVAAELLHRTGLLAALVQTGCMVYVHSGAVQDWRGLAEVDLDNAPTLESIERIRTVLRHRLLTGRVRLLAASATANEIKAGLKGSVLADLFAVPGQADAIALDDRMLNAVPGLVAPSGATVPVVCALDLLGLLVQRGLISSSALDEDIHLLRKRCFYALPLDASTLLAMLGKVSLGSNRTLTETARLKTLREYLARLHSTDVLRTPDDLIFLDSLWRAASTSIRELWANGALSLDETVAKCDWIVKHVMPTIEVCLRNVSDLETKSVNLAAAMFGFSLIPQASTPQRQAAQRSWIEDSLISQLLPGNSDVIDSLVGAIERSLLDNARTLLDDSSVEAAHP